MKSLRRVLLVALLTTIAVASGISAAMSYRASLIEANELFDAKLAQSARVLRALLGHQLDQHSARPQAVVVRVLDLDLQGAGEALATAEGHVYESKLAFQVFTEEQRLLLRSENAPLASMAPLSPGFGHAHFLGGHWRTFVMRTLDGHSFVLAERDEIRAELAAEIALGTALPPLLAIPVMALLIVLIVHWATLSMTRMANEIEQRPVDRLDPLDAQAVPRELSGLVQALNRLFERVRSTIEREQRFTADAAHELRTPIAALKLHAQNLANSTDQAQQQESAQGLMVGIDRCQRLVTQMLELTRLEQSELVLKAQPIELGPIVRQVIADLAPDALRKGVEIELEEAGPMPIIGDGLLLGVLARNLIENAVRHGPANGLVRVSLLRQQRAELRVTDAGSGIALEQREQMFERFHRASTAASGNGLGLSIVRRIAQLHEASIEMLQGPTSFTVSVRFALAGD